MARINQLPSMGRNLDVPYVSSRARVRPTFSGYPAGPFSGDWFNFGEMDDQKITYIAAGGAALLILLALMKKKKRRRRAAAASASRPSSVPSIIKVS